MSIYSYVGHSDAEGEKSLDAEGLDYLHIERVSTVQLVNDKNKIKTLYGLKQAPRIWYDMINMYMMSLEFTKNDVDSNLY